jgi:hypothetical protein
MIALITRCKNEPYVGEFVNYYLNQGIDHIYILDDMSKDGTFAKVLNNDKVTITQHKIESWDKQFVGCQNVYKGIKDKYEWIIVIDMDEYITAIKNINNTIKQELETTFKDYDCIKIPWVMMSCNSIKKNPEILLETNIYRWNHDNKHNNTVNNIRKFRCRYNAIEVKCIFKPKFFDSISMHVPISNNKSLKVVDSIYLKESINDGFYNNLRENDIKIGYLLCYHYRIISMESCLKKIRSNLHYNKFKISDLLSTDYPEIEDETLKKKSLKQQNLL